MAAGSIGVSIQEDKKLDLEFICSAEAAVKDWEKIVLAVASHAALLEAAEFAFKNLRPRGGVKADYSGHLAMATLSKAIDQAKQK